MLRQIMAAALAALALGFPGAASASDGEDEARARFAEALDELGYDAILADAMSGQPAVAFMIANSGNIRAVVVGCEDSCRGVRIRLRAAGLPEIDVQSSGWNARTAVLTVPDAYRLSYSNFEVQIDVTCAEGERCIHRRGVLRYGVPRAPSRISLEQWNAAGDVVPTRELRWRQRPNPDDLRFYYPTDAWRTNLSGAVDLQCIIIAGGELQCRVGAESPVQRGFGDAAIKLASLLRLEATDAAGASLTGRRVLLPIRFETGAP